MKKGKKDHRSLNFEQLYSGYSKSIENAMDLLDGAQKIWNDQPAIALGLSELGQEELGKSLSFLSAFYFLEHDPDWKWFWNSWRDHKLKAHRAFFYEHFSPLRIIIDPHGPARMEGRPLRTNIKHEKEAAFYVEFLQTEGRFVSPRDNIKLPEVFNRWGTLFCLGVTAQALRSTLDHHGDLERNYKVFSELALRVCSQRIYQRDMPDILREFSSRSPYHADLINNVDKCLTESRKAICSMNKDVSKDGGVSGQAHDKI